MSYTPKSWTTGDKVRTTDLNHMEQGIANAGSALIVTVANVNGTLTMDKTAQEIYDAITSGTPAYCKYTYGTPAAEYEWMQWLAPIAVMYGYAQTENLRIVVNRPTRTDNISSGTGSFLHAPSTTIFAASSMSAYPTFYRTIKPTTTSVISENATGF